MISCVLAASSAHAAPELVSDVNRGAPVAPRIAHFASTPLMSLWSVQQHNDRKLWKLDANGTSRVRFIDGDGRGAVAVNGFVYFVDRFRVLRTDGTALGTYLVKDFALAPNSTADGTTLIAFDNAAYAFAKAGRVLELWRIESTLATLIRRFESSSNRVIEWTGPAVAGGALVFSIDAGEGNILWRSDGTDAGTVALHTFERDVSARTAIALPSGELLVSAYTFEEGNELWSVGENGARLFLDLNPGRESGVAAELGHVMIDGAIYFAGASDRATSGIFRTDGTLANTERVHSGVLHWRDYPLQRAGRSVFSGAADGRIFAAGPAGERTLDFIAGPSLVAHGAYWVSTSTTYENVTQELIRIDGDSFDVRSLLPKSTGVRALAIAESQDGIQVVVASDRPGLYDVLAFAADGTPRGSLGQIESDADASTYATGVLQLGEELLYRGTVGEDELWIAQSGDQPRAVARATTSQAASIGDRALFTQFNRDGADELHTVEAGASESTRLRAFGAALWQPFAAGGSFFFHVQRDALELWRTEGTLESTRVVERPDGGRWIMESANFGDEIFVRTSSSAGDECWRYRVSLDAFDTERVSIADAVRNQIHPIGVINERYTVLSYTSIPVRNVRIETFWPAHEVLFESTRYQWRTPVVLGDQILLFGDQHLERINPATKAATELELRASALQFLGVAGALAYFSAEDDEHGRELWATDGERTWLVRDISAGRSSSDPRTATAIGDRLVFAADDGVFGREIWQSDGTRENTRLTFEVAPGPASGALALTYREPYTQIGEHVYFRGHTREHGVELWRFAKSELDQVWTPPLTELDPSCSCRTARSERLRAEEHLTGAQVEPIAQRIVRALRRHAQSFADPAMAALIIIWIATRRAARVAR